MFDDEMLVGDRTTESIFHFFRNHVTSQVGKNRCAALIEQFAIDLSKLIRLQNWSLRRQLASPRSSIS